VIEVWQNKETEAPSFQIGGVVMDLGKEETEAQAELFKEVMNHPDAVAGGAVRAPLTTRIALAAARVLQEEIDRLTIQEPKKRMPHKVEVSVERS
jgi:hypothetical protein